MYDLSEIIKELKAMKRRHHMLRGFNTKICDTDTETFKTNNYKSYEREAFEHDSLQRGRDLQ